MPSPLYTFETPTAISVDLQIEFGGARIIAGDRKSTVVEVRPAREGRRADIEAAERTLVRFASGRLEVRAPKPRYLGLIGRPGAVDVILQVPTGSGVQGSSSYGDFDTEGRLGDCFFKTSYGSLQVQDAGALTLQTSAGNITARRVTGVAEMSTSSGEIRIEETSAPANLKTSAGDVRVERAGDALQARTAYGGIRVSHAVRGQLDLTTSYGDVEVGVADGTATFLELRSNHGRVRNELDRVDDPPESGEFLKVRALTAYGDITIRRA
ncbi:MAG TPA: DUF4097 family beta strand repeat-containing protein [Candidatus Sulfotelmatobacter sp.]|nr:DUF4097 family beta strand repeat-containing protein [Candidatus Sulfotelmatobacter sp.]